ncbi:hypothetical protein BWQ96_04179 [Gracilariopsis chorda]|uniref:Uncharacterized protein n=1 Tax=Gracilariopsis chorda TaxID=448386 RepID=A0A2V3IV52_9FLOR|nr:hypothetical protein BWQ96_04179 [Gracilariopsis chorda]|eukprot:PXF46004.1 hypothetical protein BWQ96_04179 [Gracilariopsis chorda]
MSSRGRGGPSKAASVPGSSGLPRGLPPLPRDILDIPGRGDRNPAPRGARSDARPTRSSTSLSARCCGYFRFGANPAVTEGEAMSSRSDEYTLRDVEAHMRILQNSHVGLLQEMTKIRQRWLKPKLGMLQKDVRVLRSDVNQIMEHRQVSAACTSRLPHV